MMVMMMVVTMNRIMMMMMMTMTSPTMRTLQYLPGGTAVPLLLWYGPPLLALLASDPGALRASVTMSFFSPGLIRRSLADVPDIWSVVSADFLLTSSGP